MTGKYHHCEAHCSATRRAALQLAHCALAILALLQPAALGADAVTLLLTNTSATIGSSSTINIGGTTSGLGYLFRTSTSAAITDITAVVKLESGTNRVEAYEASSVELYSRSANGELGRRLGSFAPPCDHDCSAGDISTFGSTAFFEFRYEGKVDVSAGTRYWLLINSTARGDFSRRFFLPLGNFSYGDSPWRFATSTNWYFIDSFTDSYSSLSSAPLLAIAGSAVNRPTEPEPPEPAPPTETEQPEPAARGAVPVPAPRGAALVVLGLALTLVAVRASEARRLGKP